MKLQLVATCGLGLEEILAAELHALGARDPRIDRGAVLFSGSWENCWTANWRLRSANRVLVRLAGWAAPNDQSLARGIESLLLGRKARKGEVMVEDLPGLFHPDRSIAVQASCSASTVMDSQWAALKIKDGICDAQRRLHDRRSEVDRQRPDLPLRLRLHRERATLLLDSSGAPLDRRGYRVESGEAPVRENLAAACVLASGWRGKGNIADPLCGTGTLLAEAASIALGRAPNHLRTSWALEGFPSFERAAWGRVRQAPIPAPHPEVRLFGNDEDPAAIDAAWANLETALLDKRTSLRVGSLQSWRPPAGPGLLLLNPPHDKRLIGGRELWQDIGELLKGRCSDWTAVILSGEEPRWESMRIRPSRVIPVRNGPLEGQIVVFSPRRRPRG
ncbi:MAG: hypothetical protein VX498_15355 [Myxococcota bacterium]|nr:hypothetical protein [Myxococcota bacterium]